MTDTQIIEARQKVLEEYISCSCPECKEGEEEKKKEDLKKDRQLGDTLSFLNPFNLITYPQRVVTNLLRSCETKVVLDTVKVLRRNLRDVQLRNHRLAARVACNCPESKKCRKLLDPLIFSIVTGANDTSLERAFWQYELEGFPAIIDRVLVDRMNDAVQSLLDYLNIDPATTPRDAPPAKIFAEGADSREWLKRPTHVWCQAVDVNFPTPTERPEEVIEPVHENTASIR